nr:DUF1722 domain-containing protein [Staphylococcus canis]
MMRHYHDYIYIKNLIKEGIDYHRLLTEIDTILQKPIDHKAFINTFQHLWGYFKKDATSEDKEKYQQLLIDLGASPVDYIIYIQFIQMLIQKYHNDYLLNSAIMDL